MRGGVAIDRAMQLDGDMTGRWGLNRGERIRYRVNLLQGTAGRQDSTIGWTMRVIPSDIPPLKGMELDPELMANILPAKRSEERRGGNESRFRGSLDYSKQNK